MISPVVELRGVTKAYPPTGVSSQAGAPRRDRPAPVLSGVDLVLMPGEKASLIGASGSGKSTLLALIAGLLRTDDGTVLIEGTDLATLDDRGRAALRARRIGVALQSDNLIPFLTARENVELALGFGPKRSRRARRAEARSLLERFGVAHRADHRPRHLSGGETQRAALAVAMANRPSLLLADEVVAQLDGDTANRVTAEVLAADSAVLYVTHHLALADRAQRRLELCGGLMVDR
ncbi:MAG: ATP-binding cassette domain-containing protein [Microthrixaceae bacterium]